MRAVILAGGTGTRLRPYTTILPKPLMPVGNYPIAETIVRQLRYYGFTEVTFAVGYLHQLIEAYFGDGATWDVRIDYLREDRPLGTAGPLANLTDFDRPLLVMNGDILTDLDYRRFYQSHLDSRAELSIAAFEKQINIDLGVLETDAQASVTHYLEKPSYSHKVSMGVYAFSPSVLELIPAGVRCDFPDLVQSLLTLERRVKAYSHRGLWLDIGRTEDYLSAADVMDTHADRLLPTQPLVASTSTGIASP